MKVRTTCPYCGVGCGVVAEVERGELIAVSGDAEHRANRGRLCVKGSTLVETQSTAGRLLYPEVHGERVDWDVAISTVAEQFRQTAEIHGPDSVAFYLSGQLLTEDYYVANKLMKGFIGSANVDTNSRLCMSSAVAAHKRAFGEDVVPCSYDDLDAADLFVLVGSNAAWAHPVIYQRMIQRVKNHGAKLVVVDPRRTATCEMATMHLAIKPGADTALFNGLLRYLTNHRCLDEKFINERTSGFQSALDASSDPAIDLEAWTGLAQDELEAFFSLFAATTRTMTLFSQGVNQSSDGTAKGNAIINCHLATGRIGKPGMGPFSLTGQPNAMGGREVGGMANQLAAHMDFEPEYLDRVSRFWNAPNLVQGPGSKAVEMFDRVARGEIKAIWIMATNPVVSLPDSSRVAAALEACPTVVVSDCVRSTDTTRFADVLLPAAAWGEKNGTVTNSERCISRQRRLLDPPGEARPDWQIVCDVAAAMGYAEAFAYADVSEVFIEHAALSGFENDGARVFDISALADLDAEQYDRLEPVSWPLGDRTPATHFSTEDGLARFVPVVSRQPPVTGQLIVNTGRLRDQWHTMTRTGVAEKLFLHQSHPLLEISPADAECRDLQTGDLAQLSNAVGSIKVPVRVSRQVQDGHVFLPMHWSHQFSNDGVNRIVPPVIDPVSGQPALKLSEASVEKIPVSRWLRIQSVSQLSESMLESLAPLFRCYFPVTAAGVYDVAIQGDDVQTWLAALPASSVVTHTDQGTDGFRAIGLDGNVPAWLMMSSERLEFSRPSRMPLTWSYQQLALDDDASGDASPRVCTCFEVSEASIREAVRGGVRTVEALGEQLRCGTNCGSCIPELGRIIEEVTLAGSAEEVAVHVG